MLSVFFTVIDSPEDMSFFEHLYTAHRAFLVKYACSLLHNTWDAEDVVEEVFFSVIKVGLKRIKTFKNETYVLNYLAVAVRNRCFSKYTYDKKHGTLPLDDILRTADAGSSSDPAANAEYQLLKNAIAALPQTYADTLVLALVYELSVADIAELLAVSSATVRKRLERGKKILRQKLGEAYLK